MTYTITVRVRQSRDEWCYVVEQTVWKYANGGSWTALNGQHVLKMGGSGTSGTIRFETENGSHFLFGMGVHNYKPWSDIVTDLQPGNTGSEIQPQYYDDAGRSDRLWAQAAHTEKRDSAGRKLAISITQVGSSNDYIANVVIA